MSVYDLLVAGREESRKKPKKFREFSKKSAGKFTGFAARNLDRLVSPHKNSLRNLSQIPLTATGVGFMDFAAFHLAHGWGWLVTGISLVIVEHIIADGEDE